ncbi:MAG: HNH endonuclease [Sphingomonadaceae bacterium]
MAIRKRILARHPICVECIGIGNVTKDSISTIVDHVVSLAEGGTNDDSNLVGMCRDHHDRKTQAEAARAQGRTYRPKVRIGRAGWPE